ncbi:hypothetical protein ACFL3T_03005 [Patescibacteria group bacterium]
MAGQKLYYPIKITDFPERVLCERFEVLQLLMANYERLQAVVSDALVDLGCDPYCVIDPEFEREDLLGTGFSRVRGKNNLLLKEGKTENGIPEKDLVIPGCQYSVQERLVRCLGPRGDLKFLKIVDNLAGCEYLGETSHYSLEQNMQVLLDAMRKSEEDHMHGKVDRDIKSENILVQPDPTRALGVRGRRCDRELQLEEGQIPCDPGTNMRICRGTPSHFDIAYYVYPQIETLSARTSVDVFAYGITLLTLYLGKGYDDFLEEFHKEIKDDEGEFTTFLPYEKAITKEDIFGAMKRAKVEADIPERMLYLIISMLKKNRSLRPILRVVMRILKEEYNLE